VRQGRFQAILLVFGHPACPRLPGELPVTSQLKCFQGVSLLHGGHSWKLQRPLKDKPHYDDELKCYGASSWSLGMRMRDTDRGLFRLSDHVGWSECYGGGVADETHFAMCHCTDL